MKKNSSTRSMSTWTRLAVTMVATTVVLSACALGKMGYQNADTVGLLWINRYLDMSSEQKDFIKPRMKSLLAWHRKTQLPEYGSFTGELQKKAMANITVADVAAVEAQFKTLAETSIHHALPDLADLALQLKPENIKAMQEKFVENDKKFRDDYKMKRDVEKQQEARYDKTLERLEDWYGRLDREQRAAVRKLSDARPLNNDYLLAERQRRQADLIALLTKVEREKPAREQIVTMMRTYADHFEVSPDRARRAFQESLRKASDEMNAAIHNLTTPEQRAKAAKKLQGWVEDFREMEKG